MRVRGTVEGATSAAFALGLLALVSTIALMQAAQTQILQPGNSTTNGGAVEAMKSRPLAIAPNRGQADRSVRYEARGAGFGFYFTRSKVVFTHASGGKAQALEMRFQGANPHPTIEPAERLGGRVNYLRGADPARWHRGLPTYRQLAYRNLWPGVDMLFRGSDRGGLRYEFIVRPGAHISRIRLQYAGARRLSLTSGGALMIHTALGSIRDLAPRSFQRVHRVEVPVKSAFAVQPGTASFGFTVAKYDRSRTLIIDPELAYSTFLGGRDDDLAHDVAVDDEGNAYVTGGTQSFDFHHTPGAFDESEAQTDVFVTKLNADGSNLVYSTFLGGSDSDSTLHAVRRGGGIAVDRLGNAYVTGMTESADFPTTPGAFDTTHTGRFDNDVFVTKLNASGSALVYSTLLGRQGQNEGYDIAIDRDGNAYVTGVTQFAFPTTLGSFDPVGPPDSSDNAFVTKINPTGSALVYSTLLAGDTPFDSGQAIAVDASRKAYVAGYTAGGFPTTDGAYDTTRGAQAFGVPDGFITKLNETGSALVYSTYLGGLGGDAIEGLEIDGDGSAYATGLTNSSDFPTTPGAFDATFDSAAGGFDGFVTKVSPDGSSLIYSTYLTGSGDDFPRAVAVDRHGSAYVAGQNAITVFHGGDAFLNELDPSGSSVRFSKVMGGPNDDSANGIALDRDGGVYMAGHTESANFPTTPGSFNPRPAFSPAPGDAYAWVAKLLPDFDQDGVLDGGDNCPDLSNLDQRDTDGDGIGDECDPSPGNTPCRVKGAGTLSTNPAARFQLIVRFEAGATDPVGRAFHFDRVGRLRFRSTRITSVIGSGSQATIRGAGRANNSLVDFRIDVQHSSAKGSRGNFRIELSNGYSASGEVRKGHLAIECP